MWKLMVMRLGSNSCVYHRQAVGMDFSFRNSGQKGHITRYSSQATDGFHEHCTCY